MLKNTLKSKKLLSVLGRLLAKYIRFVQRTSTIVRDPENTDKKLIDAHPIILATWHGQILLVPLVKPKSPPLDVQVIAARHGDAEIAAEAIQHFGVSLLRGSGAGPKKRDRGGARVLRESINALKGGSTIVMTADIPPGPARKAGKGTVMLAKHSGRPVIPCAIITSRYIRLNTWDRFMINLPFSKMAVVVGDPVWVKSDAGPDGMEAARLAIEDGLNKVTQKAYDLAGVSPGRLLTDPGQLNKNTNPGLSLRAYCALTEIAQPIAPFILSYRAKRGKEDPKREPERLGYASHPRPEGTLAWFHTASVGELNAALPLIDAITKQYPNTRLLLTTGTVTSAHLAKERLPASAFHQFVPLDAPKFVARFLDHWKPDLALFIESEIWPNLILQTAERNIPLMLINGRLSKRSYRSWRRKKGFSLPLFSRFELILAQNNILAERFQALGARRVEAIGNLKIDAPPPPVNETELERIRAAAGGRRIFLAASTHLGEDGIVAQAHKTLHRTFPDLLTIIVPRHPQRSEEIAKSLSEEGLSSCRRSLGELPQHDHDIYIADTIGELGTFYSLCPVSFIGGSIVPRGGQNPIEAVRLGSAVLTGPSRHNFKDAYKDMFRLKGCLEIRSADTLASAVNDLLTDEDRRKLMVTHAAQALDNLGGALELTMKALEPYLPANQGLRRAS